MCFVSFLCVSEVEVVLPFCSFLYLSRAGMLYTIIPPIHFNGDALCTDCTWANYAKHVTVPFNILLCFTALTSLFSTVAPVNLVALHFYPFIL